MKMGLVETAGTCDVKPGDITRFWVKKIVKKLRILEAEAKAKALPSEKFPSKLP
jgi:hypothetical protein